MRSVHALLLNLILLPKINEGSGEVGGEDKAIRGRRNNLD